MRTAEKFRRTTEEEREVFKFLDELRESGRNLTFSSQVLIQEEFLMEEYQAMELLILWMNNYAVDAEYITIKY